MEFTLYDAGGRAIAYCEDGRHLYAFDGSPLAYLDGDSVYAFHGEHLGWWDHGWVRDHHGACVLFTEGADVLGPSRPSLQASPVKRAQQPTRTPAYRLPKPMRAPDVVGWSLRSGPQFFQPAR